MWSGLVRKRGKSFWRLSSTKRYHICLTAIQLETTRLPSHKFTANIFYFQAKCMKGEITNSKRSSNAASREHCYLDAIKGKFSNNFALAPQIACCQQWWAGQWQALQHFIFHFLICAHFLCHYLYECVCVCLWARSCYLQNFVFEFPYFAYFQATSAPVLRMQEPQPQFRLNSLEPGREYQFLVYAVNAKGRSEPPVVIERVRVAAQLGPYGKSR